MKLQFLGACANQTATHETVSFLVLSEGNSSARLLVDTGPGVVGTLQRIGRTCAEIESLFLTHVHADHIAGFAYFVWHRFFESLGSEIKPGDLRVVGSEDVLKAARTQLETSYNPETFPFKIVYEPITASKSIELWPGVRFTPVTADHTVPTLGCVLESEKRKIAYSADTLPTDGFAEAAKGSDLMIHEGMWDSARFAELAMRTKHATGLDAGQIGNRAEVGSLGLVHTFPALLGSEEIIIAEAAERFAGPIFVPSTGTIV